MLYNLNVDIGVYHLLIFVINVHGSVL